MTRTTTGMARRLEALEAKALTARAIAPITEAEWERLFADLLTPEEIRAILAPVLEEAKALGEALALEAPTAGYTERPTRRMVAPALLPREAQ